MSVSVSFNTKKEGNVSLVAAISRFINNCYRYNIQTVPELCQGYFSNLCWNCLINGHRAHLGGMHRSPVVIALEYKLLLLSHF